MNERHASSWGARGRFVLAALALICAGLSAPAVHAEQAVQIIETLSRSQIKDIMKAEGYAVSIDDDGDILWKLEGLRTFILVSKDEKALQFHAAFSDGNATLKKANEWNRSKRFSHTYLDDKGDPHLQLDLDLAGGVTRARVVDFLKTCRISFLAWVDEVVK